MLLGVSMINRIKNLFSDAGRRREAAPAHHTADELHLAAAALLVEAARLDDRFDPVEWETIRRLVQRRFALSEEEAKTLVETANQEAERAVELYRFARIIKDRFDHAERLEMIEMLWEVVYADGTVDHYEANLLRRVAGLIYVSDRECGGARKRVQVRLGVAQARDSE